MEDSDRSHHISNPNDDRWSNHLDINDGFREAKWSSGVKWFQKDQEK